MDYKYKTELHCHTKYVSTCATADAKSLVEQYLDYGYTTVVITDHLHCGTFGVIDDKTLNEKIEYFLEGWRSVREAAGDRLNILLGAEIRFPGEGGTDYLIYGADEGFFMNNPDMYLHDKYWTGSLVHNNNLMFFQAHPFRFNIKSCENWVVDGCEVYNGHPTQLSHNSIAEAWAKLYPNYIGISGSDHHDDCQYPDAGILTREPIKDNQQLLTVLRSGDFRLIRDEETRMRCLEDIKRAFPGAEKTRDFQRKSEKNEAKAAKD